MSIEHLGVEVGDQQLVRDVSLAIRPRSVHCLVGDSGSGKTLTSLAAVGLLPTGARATGSVRLGAADDDLTGIDQKRWSEIRGALIGYVGQNALGCLHPAYTIGFQVAEAIRRHRPLSRSATRGLVLDELAAVDLRDPERVARSRPAQLSGGMCQRVALAIALSNRPAVLIADEPTTALDGATQDHVLELVRSRVERDGLSVLLITHDHTVVAAMADDTTSITDGVSSPSPPPPSPPARPRVAVRPGPRTATTLEVQGVAKVYGRSGPLRGQSIPVLAEVHLSAARGTTIGLVGRSGAGKTTLARIVAGLLSPTAGSVRIDGRPIAGAGRVGRVERAGLVQYVFQDPFGSLNPRRRAIAQVAEPLIAAGTASDEAHDRARTLLGDVGLTAAQIERLPSALSGGQCQRVGIARALIRRPSVVVLDEPVSALDWSVRDEILAILDDLQVEIGALYLLIAHERPLVERQCDRIYEVAGGTLRPL